MNEVLTDGFARVESNFWHRRNAEVVWKGSDGFQLMFDDPLLLGHCKKTPQVACRHTATIATIQNRQRTSTRGQSNLTKSTSRGAHSPVRGHPRGWKVVPLNSWGKVSY